MDEKTILYVEDNFHNRRIVRKILGTRGYTILEAEDGLVGYEMICEIKPPLVLLDIALPHLDGMQIVQRLKADNETKHIPVVALTASAMRGDRERFLEAGCDDYLSKPVRATELVEMVDKYFAHIKVDEAEVSEEPQVAAEVVEETSQIDEAESAEVAAVAEMETVAELAEETKDDEVAEEAVAELPEETEDDEVAEEAAAELAEETEDDEVAEAAIEEEPEVEAVSEVEEVEVEEPEPIAAEEIAEVEVTAEVVEIPEPVEVVEELSVVGVAEKQPTASYDQVMSDNVSGLFGEESVIPATPDVSAQPMVESPVASVEMTEAVSASIWVMDENPSDARLMRRLIGAKLKVDALEVSPNFDSSSFSDGAPSLILFGTSKPNDRTYTSLHAIRAKARPSNTPIFLLSSESLSAEERERVSEYVDFTWTKDKLMDSNFLRRIADALSSIFSRGDKEKKEPQVNGHHAGNPSASNNGTASVLVIEDIPDSAELAKKILANNNYGVHIADSGEAGLKMALEHEPKMILLDLGLPDVDGQTLLGVLRAEETLKDTPIIVCTAWPEDALKEIVESYGFDDYISKPYKVNEFMSVVSKYS